jgi:ribosome-associated heat shock protein Hsp15
VRIGDRLSLSIQQQALDIDVLAIPVRRGSATEAQACYAQTPDSLQRGLVLKEQHRLAALSRPRSDTRPDKRERRQLDKLRRSQG